MNRGVNIDYQTILEARRQWALRKERLDYMYEVYTIYLVFILCLTCLFVILLVVIRQIDDIYPVHTREEMKNVIP